LVEALDEKVRYRRFGVLVKFVEGDYDVAVGVAAYFTHLFKDRTFSLISFFIESNDFFD
jgi:hypothetical protein